MKEVIKRLYASYSSKYIHLLHTKPIITKAATSGTLYFLSDSLVQGIEIFSYKDKEGTERPKYKLDRSLRMAVFGFCVTGPVFHYWYNLLDKWYPKKTSRHIYIKMLIDQTTCAPIFNAVFFTGMGILEGKNLDQIKEKLKKDWWETYRADCMVWPIINFLNFKYISNHHRVNFMNCGNILWTAFLAKMNFSH
ncbi:hypothetical protein DICPUDRAFT_28562 [Dictyostelium purpureum]|uniref:Pmp22 family protein n=1 Tax=Dictyostelium purpureum TaxID=5786 RepID=F0ZC21_DICPU|nr:uncharacterized protein DICPUDRAFT_28562 [Dictyostelium purpureum]EGC38494.1 hypothetical protein DICPUDRAFT_28562 [Dictyostelium purpureum]|eukprot:XP_003284959.1 hypothetical protein DICPUDRAFT_28562 [Dictyostelium purpureum]